jgi:hypothetical protein
VFEAERFVPLRGWSHTNLSSSDWQRYSRNREAGPSVSSSETFPQVGGRAHTG